MAEHSLWHLFPPLTAAIAALGGAAVALVAARTVASRQISEQRRKEADELLRLRSAATIQMAVMAGGVIKDFKVRKAVLAGFVRRRQNNKTEVLYCFSKNDVLWKQITTLGSIRQNYPIFDKGIEIVSHASIVCQSTFWGVHDWVIGYDEMYQRMLAFGTDNDGVLIEMIDGLMSHLDMGLAGIKEDAERFNKELKELTAAQTIAEITLRQ